MAIVTAVDSHTIHCQVLGTGQTVKVPLCSVRNVQMRDGVQRHPTVHTLPPLQSVIDRVLANWRPRDHQTVDHALLSAGYTAAEHSAVIEHAWSHQEDQQLARAWCLL